MDRLRRDKLVRWIDAEDQRFIALLDATLAEGASRAPGQLACRVGCTECCTGAFPITPLDARRLRHGLARMRTRDPRRAEGIVARARAAAAQDGESVPCPVLDPATGACELYDARPVTCRTYGAPVRIGDKDLPPCRLCFTDASPAQIEQARATIDEEGNEHVLLVGLEALGAHAEPTLIALALIEGDAPDREQ